MFIYIHIRLVWKNHLFPAWLQGFLETLPGNLRLRSLILSLWTHVAVYSCMQNSPRRAHFARIHEGLAGIKRMVK